VWTSPVGRSSHSYQTSDRSHWTGTFSVDGWKRSPDTTVFSAVASELSPLGRAPSRPVKKLLPSSASATSPMPKKPPPSSMYSWSAVSCAVLRRSPAVLRKITAR
jgi:hypothetical protein